MANFFEYRIEGDAKAVIRDLKVDVPKLQRQATVTALNKTVNKIFAAARRELRAETGVPSKHLNIRKYPANRNRLRARVWMGFKKKIPLSTLTKVKKYRGKGKYAKYVNGPFSEPTFKATMRSGHEGFFARSGKSRLPIKELKVDLNEPGTKIIERVGRRIGPSEFKRQFEYDLRRRLKKRATKR